MSAESVLTSMQECGCPCRFPRFVYLVGFNFQDYGTLPVACRDTEDFVHASYFGSRAFLDLKAERIVQDSTHRDYTCRFCGAEWEAVFTDFSISMSRTYLALRSPAPTAPLGAPVVLPFPVAGGFFGFNREHIEKCAQNFRPASSDECTAYILELL